MNWREKSSNRLISDKGYEVAATAIKCTVRWIANSPNRQLLAIHGNRQLAIDDCEHHYREQEMTIERVTVAVELTNLQAQALAQFVKRIGWKDIRGNAVDFDEAHMIRDAIEEIRSELREVGYCPR